MGEKSKKYDEIFYKLLIEEFKENWAYIRHSEEIRLKHTNIYLIVAGSGLTLFSYLLKSSDGLNPDTFSVHSIGYDTYWTLILISFLFVGFYGLLMIRYFVNHKIAYDLYREYNRDIHDVIKRQSTGAILEIRSKIEPKNDATHENLVRSSFLHWLSLPASISSLFFSFAAFLIISRIFINVGIWIQLMFSVMIWVWIFRSEQKIYVKRKTTGIQ